MSDDQLNDWLEQRVMPWLRSGAPLVKSAAASEADVLLDELAAILASQLRSLSASVALLQDGGYPNLRAAEAALVQEAGWYLEKAAASHG